MTEDFSWGGGVLVPAPNKKFDDLIVTTAMLLGGEPTYNDYGHPERAKSRKYWSIRPAGSYDAFGFTKVDACRFWLLKKGMRLNHRTGEMEKCVPHSFLDK